LPKIEHVNITLIAFVAAVMGATSSAQAQSAAAGGKLDRTAPVLTVFSPYQGEVFPTGTTAVTVRGSILDHESGVTSVRCNGGSGAVTGNSYDCTAPVIKGLQTIRVTSTDHAGNATSRQVSVSVGTPPLTSITISPAKMTLTAGERRPISVVDQAGRPVSGWTVKTANPEIVEILIEDGETFVLGIVAGHGLVTASMNGLTSSASLNVSETRKIEPAGMVLWSLYPSPSTIRVRRGEVLRPMIGLTVTDNPPSLYFIDHDRQGASPVGPAFIRAVSIDGHELWRHMTAGPIQHPAADNDGGLVILLADGSPFCCDHVGDAIRRIDPSGRVSWEYLSIASTGRLSDMSLVGGRVFVVERRNSAANANEPVTELVALDEGSGAVLHRWTLGYSADSDGHRYPLQTTHPIGLEDGSLVIVAHRFEGHDGRLVKFTLRQNELVETPIHGSPLPGPTFVPVLRGLIPDGHGGFLAAADNTATIFGVTSANTLAGPLELGMSSSGVRDHLVHLVLGENGAVALVQDWWGSAAYSSAAKIVFFDPRTLAITREHTLPEEVGIFPRLLSHALAGGGVAWTDMTNGFGSEIVSGLFAGWNDSEPSLIMRRPPTLGGAPAR
jgi:Glucodextranase, domain B